MTTHFLDRRQASRLASVCLLLLLAGAVQAAADKPSVAVSVGPKASDLERFGADELCRYLGDLFGVRALPSNEPAPAADFALLVGSPQTNPAVAKALGDGGWPKVSDQGIVLKHARLGDRPALVVGGGSPRATLWAVYELVERWGCALSCCTGRVAATARHVSAAGGGRAARAEVRPAAMASRE